MFANNYYTLVAGFREYALDGDTKGFDIDEILLDIEETVSAADWQAVELLYTYYDCENLVGLRNGTTAYNRLGRIAREELENELQNPTLLSKELATVVRAYTQPDGEDAEEVATERPFALSLFEAYYAKCSRSSSRLLRQWSEAERTLRNVVAALSARERGVAIENVVVGAGDTVDALRRSSAADFGLRGELQWIDTLITTLSDERNIIEKERKIDLIRWSIVDGLSEQDYFNINAVLAYLIKVNIVARWAQLDRKVGAEMFERLLADLNGKERINKL
ncbi:MAG: DUF2764 family protein [Alistipes sp.]|nr:DUF2764 family protein [Alistipes sp.]